MKTRLARLPVIAAAALALGVGNCMAYYPVDTEPVLFMDWLSGGEIAEIVPGAPMIEPGPDLQLGTADDVVFPFRPGDVDLVIRSARTTMGGSFPPPHTPATEPRVTVAAFTSGTPIDFVVAPASASGAPVVSPNLVGVPILVTAFADLDGDGFVGITELDGDSGDAGIEDAELTPVAKTVVVSNGGEVAGQLFPSAGGPSGAPLRLALAAGAWAGTLDPNFLGGVVPDGPLVTTKLPFHPETDPNEVLQGGPTGPPPPIANGPVAAEIKEAFEPDPLHPRIGEVFHIALDGSEMSADTVTARSGPALRAGVARRPSPATFDSLPSRTLRPALDSLGQRTVLEVLQRLPIADDGAGTQMILQVVPVDLLGNVADPAAAMAVVVRVEGPLAILSPDADGDPLRETLNVADARGVEITVDDLGGTFDDPNTGTVHVEDASGAVSRTPVFLPDPDVDDTGLVDAADVALVDANDGLRDGDPGFDPDLDLTGDGRIDAADAAAVQAALGQTVAVP